MALRIQCAASVADNQHDCAVALYLGATSPGADKESNWLPAPAGTFSLLLRNYWPDQAVIDGTWLPPDVVKVN